MAWSTRQLAEFAGTTLKTVRYYHKIGLLTEPERMSNGYKQYQIRHLIQLLRIRRLVDLGLPLSDIAAMEESDENTESALRTLDAELTASIERQQRMRAELAVVLQNPGLADLLSGYNTAAGELSGPMRILLLIYSQAFGPSTITALQNLLSVPPTSTDIEFETLPSDASADTRQQLAERYVPEIRQHHQDYPPLADVWDKAPRGQALNKSVIKQALVELYNPAQLDVLRRVDLLVTADETAK